MRQVRALVCDDEPEAREGLRALLCRDPEIAVVGEASDGREAAALLMRLSPDLVLLDVQMPELDGFGALAAVRTAILPIVVFVTAYDAYALRAFEVHAIDYLLKPFTDARFADALASAKAQVRQRWAGALGQQLAALLQSLPADPAATPGTAVSGTSGDGSDVLPPYVDRLLVRTAHGAQVVRLEQIDWIEACDYYARLHVAGRAFLIRETMQSLETRLDPTCFIRVHRSAIVNVDRVKRVEPNSQGAHVLTLRDGTRLRLSRSKRAAFERAFGGRL